MKLTHLYDAMQSSSPAGNGFSGASLYDVDTKIIGTLSAILRAISTHGEHQCYEL